MFTGIITAIGNLRSRENHEDGGARFEIQTPWDCGGIAVGASIACNGACLTLVEADGAVFTADVSAETLAVTTLQSWEIGDAVNLERALALGDEMGGHMVSGHVDGVARVVSTAKDGAGHRMVFDAPDNLAHLIAPKGSVALDGVSLTVNEVDGSRFGVMVIPHTMEHTTLGKRKSGDEINLEADMLARYVARITEKDK